MKKVFIPLLLIITFLSCDKEASFTDSENQFINTRAPGEQMLICHYDEESGTYKNKMINSNALAAHLAHGDYEGPCLNCSVSCLFCAYLDMLDFDEPCLTNDYASGDYYCTRDGFLPTPPSNCENDPFGESTLWDNDYANNTSCGGSDTENDVGILFAYHDIICGVPFGQVSFYYKNYDTGEEIQEDYFEATQAAYDHAVFCRSVIDGIASQLGMIDSCSE